MLSDRFGPNRVIAAGTLIYGLGLVLTGFAQGPNSLVITLGGVVGLGMSLLTLPVVLGAVGRVVTPAQRGTAFGLVTAGGSFGQFAMVPGAQALVSTFDWQWAFILLSIAMAVAFAVSFGLAHKANAGGTAPAAGEDSSAWAALARAGRHPGYWLLTLSFFVCGFHVAFVATHLPAYLADRGISAAVAANALALIGLCNIFGSYLFGAACSRYAKKHLLSGIYAGRALLFVLMLMLPMTPALALAFGAMIGFLGLGTVPPTSGLVAQLFGTRYLATLFGVVFMSHQIGGFLGAWFAVQDEAEELFEPVVALAHGVEGEGLSGFDEDAFVHHGEGLQRRVGAFAAHAGIGGVRSIEGGERGIEHTAQRDDVEAAAVDLVTRAGFPVRRAADIKHIFRRDEVDGRL
jgi:MFS family permease